MRFRTSYHESFVDFAKEKFLSGKSSMEGGGDFFVKVILVGI